MPDEPLIGGALNFVVDELGVIRGFVKLQAGLVCWFTHGVLDWLGVLLFGVDPLLAGRDDLSQGGFKVDVLGGNLPDQDQDLRQDVGGLI